MASDRTGWMDKERGEVRRGIGERGEQNMCAHDTQTKPLNVQFIICRIINQSAGKQRYKSLFHCAITTF